MQSRRPDSWASGAAYEPFIGRWSRQVAGEFLHWLGLEDGALVLEVGCGTGALTQALTATAAPALVLATDRSADYVAFARAQNGAGPVRFVVADAMRLPVRPGVPTPWCPVCSAVLDEGRRFPVCAPEELARLWQEAGLVQVETDAVEVATPFHDFDDYWRPFLGGQGPAPSYVASLDGHRNRPVVAPALGASQLGNA